MGHLPMIPALTMPHKKSMGEDWLRQTFDIVGDHVTATGQQRIGLGSPIKSQRCSCAGTHTQIGMMARGLDNGQQVIR